MATPPPFVFDFPYPAEPFNVFTENGSTDDYYYGGYEYVYEIPDDNTTTAIEQPDAQLHVIIVPTVLFLICCVGIVGNCLVIFTIIRHVTMRLVTYLYLLNLAVVNIIYLLTSVPIQAVAYALTNWPFGRAACEYG
ncbi:hypothetical protein BaRGS_00003686 [Batillaria attramentaria]|uniref:G-protein coupled receptors family 1 profile domain-containing protein n=1 Tax=Batillaria attramentaria TaxID=370345 RepID=A0ABD0M0U7_9CAEN